MKISILKQTLDNDHGVSMILVALLLTVFMGFIALAVDIGHLYGVRNELRDAADAGALAGARVLYTSGGAAIDPNANAVALAAATANKSENAAVEVTSADVERGHWSFINNTFTPNATLTVLDFWNYTTQQLDTNINFINAVRVTAKRQSSPSIVAYFAGLFGFTEFTMQQKAVAWLGFAGSIPPGGVDQPIAICEQSILSGGTLACNIGRMLNSGGNAATHNTAAWTNFTHSCDTANGPSVNPLICANGNPNSINYGQGVGTTGGTVTSILNNLIPCWKLKTCGSTNCTPTQAWGPIRLLVIDCPGNNPGNCSTAKGVVSLTILWITGNGTDPHYNDIPRQMTATVNGTTITYTCTDDSTEASRKYCWDGNGTSNPDSFVSKFGLQNVDNLPATYDKSSMYFFPSCTYDKPTGGPSGNNYGVLSNQPRLVDWDNPYSKF
jgi:Flp pilus assembly protein TadG